MTKKFIFVCDAMRSDYITAEVMPFLNKKSSEGLFVKSVVPGNGFCERSEIFLGVTPRETGFLTAIDYFPAGGAYAWFKFKCLPVVEWFCKHGFLNKVVRRLLWELSHRFANLPMHPQNIPLSLLNKFSLTEDAKDFGCLAKEYPSGILNELTRRGLSCDFSLFTTLKDKLVGNDFDRLKSLASTTPDADVIFVYLSTADYLGHKYGPHSIEIKDGLKQLDLEIEKTCLDIESKFTDSSFMFLGDHGMEEVSASVDLWSLIRSESEALGLKTGVDFIFFLDSTMLRVWSLNDSSKALISRLKSKSMLINGGIFLTSDICEELMMPDPERIADLVWWAYPGVQICPDFFSSSLQPKKGMHGYLNSSSISNGSLIAYGNCVDNTIIDKCDLHEVYKYI
jgi:predicted AlkP superfamily pyrophosphatase or phosphodiesterase